MSWDMRPKFCEKEVAHKSLPQFWDLQKETCLPRLSSLRKAPQFCFQKEATFARELPQFCQLQLCDELERKSRVQRDREMDFDVESGMMDDGYEWDSDAVKFKLESEKVLVSSRGLSSSCFYSPPLPPLPLPSSSFRTRRTVCSGSWASTQRPAMIPVIMSSSLSGLSCPLSIRTCSSPFARLARSGPWAVALRVRAIPQAEGINFLTHLPNVVSVDVDLRIRPRLQDTAPPRLEHCRSL